MLYRHMLVALLAALSFSTTAISASLLLSNEDLAKELELKYQALNTQTQLCRESRREQIEVDKLTNKWFVDLPSKSKKIVLLIASHEAMERCTKVKADEYSLALIEYAAQAEDKKQLEEWLKIKQNFKPEELASDISSLSSEELKELLRSPQLDEPFDLIAIIKQLNL